MELHEALGTIYKYEYVARLEGKDEGKIEERLNMLCSMITKLKDKGYSKEKTCAFIKDTVAVSKDDINKAIDKMYN